MFRRTFFGLLRPASDGLQRDGRRGNRRKQSLHALPRRRGSSGDHAQPGAPGRPPQRKQWRDRRFHPGGRRPPASPPGRRGPLRGRLRRVPRRPDDRSARQRKGRPRLRNARHDRRRGSPLERLLLLGLLLPWRLRGRERHQRPGVDPGPRVLLRNLPRPASRGAAPRRGHGLELRQLPHRLHRDHRQPRHAHGRQGRRRRT